MGTPGREQSCYPMSALIADRTRPWMQGAQLQFAVLPDQAQNLFSGSPDVTASGRGVFTALIVQAIRDDHPQLRMTLPSGREVTPYLLQHLPVDKAEIYIEQTGIPHASLVLYDQTNGGIYEQMDDGRWKWTGHGTQPLR